MREAFTRQVRLLLDQAQAAARRLNQDFVGTEHLMLGLLDAGGASDAGVNAADDQSGGGRGDGNSNGQTYTKVGTKAGEAGEAGEAVRLLLRESVDLKELRERIAAALPEGSEAPIVTGDLPLSPRARRVMNLALVKAQAAREGEVSTRTVLRAMLEEPDTVLCESLKACGVDLESLQRRLAEPAGEREQ